MLDHSHIPSAGAWIKTNWHWLSASIIGLFYSVRWAVRSAVKNLHLPQHVTHKELKDCQDRVLVKLSEHERDEFARYDLHQEATKQMMSEYRKENMDAHGKINDKIDQLTHTIIENMRLK